MKGCTATTRISRGLRLLLAGFFLFEGHVQPESVARAGPQRPASGRVVGHWLGQDGHDLVGPSSHLVPSDVQDIHILLGGLPADRTITAAKVIANGGGEWTLNGPHGPWRVEVVREAGSARADLFFEPAQVETGRLFNVILTLDNGRTLEIPVAGGRADPNLRMPRAALKVAWVGQESADHVGGGPSVGPDGIVDIRMELAGLSKDVEIKSIAVDGRGLTGWRFGTNPEGRDDALLVRREADRTQADLFLNPPSAPPLHGLSLTVKVVYANGKTDTAPVTAGNADAGRRVETPTLPRIVPDPIRVTWLGQDGVSAVGPGDVHLTLEGLPRNRAIAAVALSGGARGRWFHRTDDRSGVDPKPEPDSAPLVFRRRPNDPSRADLAFPPRRDETGTTMMLRFVYADSSMAVVPFPGGRADPALRAGSDAGPNTVLVRPGDNLSPLLDRPATLRLARGVHRLKAPLRIRYPARITAEAGATLVFEQPPEGAPWREAIALEAGHITLEGFSVRFAGPIRWQRDIPYGPAVVGTGAGPRVEGSRALADLNLVRLDLEAPPPARPEGWEEAARLVRFAGAAGGRVEECTLSGGPIELAGGPWRIVGNTSRGTPAGTFSPAVIAGHDTFDLDVRDNSVRPEPDAGKTWRFLVLTGSGFRDVVASNTVEGVGPRDDDTIPNMNAPELILTESYRLKFEGRPLAISADGRLLRIPNPQGGPARSGDVVAILAGPDAGTWRRVAQALDEMTYLVDPPLPTGVEALSIATGFVGETFASNVIDARGGSGSVHLVLGGNQYDCRVLDNRFTGAGGSFKITSTPTELPVHWGWSHAPMFGLEIARNTLIDPLHGGLLAVEHAAPIKSNRGRLYLTATLRENVLVGSKDFSATWPGRTGVSGPRPIDVGDPTGLDPAELRVVVERNRAEGAPPARPDTPVRIRVGSERLIFDSRMLDLPD